MLLNAGTRLGSYEILSALGAGGMGDVYRARDTKLNRDVALKVLPEHFAADPDRLARFKREAQVLASLNHPNIAAIYGLEEGPAAAFAVGTASAPEEAGHYVRALVMELVEGPTLTDRIAGAEAALHRDVGRVSRLVRRSLGEGGSRPAGLPLDEALAVARQIADALEAAHEQGVVHRDLKPANIKVRPDGVVKVLDFGLAKALDQSQGEGGGGKGDLALSQLPTITSPAMMTGAGMILGTATYMAPEQARGRAVDKRADIWAFGCVLFEMLTGTRAFDGEDVAETLGAVIHKEPPWSTLPADTPPYLRTLLRRCLQKDPKKRLPHIGIARIEIDEGPSTDAPALASATNAPLPRGLRSNPRIAWSVAAVSVATAIALALVTSLPREPADTRVTRASILLPPGVTWTTTVPGNRISVSPDGLKLAFIGTDGGGPRLWLRPIDAETAQPLTGTEGAAVAK